MTRVFKGLSAFQTKHLCFIRLLKKEQEEQAKTSDCLSETHRKKQSPSHQSKEKVLGQL